MLESVPHVVSEGDVGTPGQQHPDHVNVLVLGCPDDGRPAPTVLRGEKRMRAQPCWPENSSGPLFLGTAEARGWGVARERTPTHPQGTSLDTFRDTGRNSEFHEPQTGRKGTSVKSGRRWERVGIQGRTGWGGRTPRDLGTGGAARLLTCALTSTCPVLSSRLTISKFPILAA